MKVDFGGPSVIFFIFVTLGAYVLFAKIIIIPLVKQHFEATQLKEINDGFSFKAGGWFDVVNLSYPFVKVTLGMDSIYIKYSGYDLVVMYNQIKSISARIGFISKGFRMEYISLERTSEISIWTPYYKQVVSYIQSKLTQS